MACLDRMIKVFVVEDSALQRELLLHILGTSQQLQVIGVAKNGLEAIDALSKLKPDVILMDLHMPQMNGVEAIAQIMSTNPFPIVAMSASTDVDELINGFHALEAGALAFTEKPGNIYDPRYEFLCSYLIQTLTLMSEIKVIRRRDVKADIPKRAPVLSIATDVKYIAIGVSTGGPLVLQTILSQLPTDFPPILIVQHIVPGFIMGLVEWLIQVTHRLVLIAEDKQPLLRGHIYFAPDQYDMGITSEGTIFLKANHSHHTPCPSVNFLFNSVAEVAKNQAMGILLTGMGNDGAEQLKHMREQGAITIAQNKETSLIYGMPGQAVLMDAALYVLSPEEIALAITSLSRGA